MYTDVHGLRMHYRIDGRDGAPWVTFINGIANDTTLWDSQIPALAQDFRLLRFDARGHGGTQATEGDYSFDLLIGDLVGLWDALGIRTSHLVGLGLGGTVAIGGADDQRGGPPAIMQELADAVPGARHVSVPHAAHICNIQNADGFNEVLGGFLRAQGG